MGCLTAGPQRTWLLTKASEPVAVVPAPAARQASETAAAPSTDQPPGTQTMQLLDAMAYAPDTHKGHTMYVRGMLIKLPGEQRLTISTFDMVSPTCPE